MTERDPDIPDLRLFASVISVIEQDENSFLMRIIHTERQGLIPDWIAGLGFLNRIRKAKCHGEEEGAKRRKIWCGGTVKVDFGEDTPEVVPPNVIEQEGS